MGLDQLAPEIVCARLEFGREVESGGKGGERSVLTWDHMCVCVCACLGFGREVELEGKGGERSVLTWDRACVCVCVCARVRVCVCCVFSSTLTFNEVDRFLQVSILKLEQKEKMCLKSKGLFLAPWGNGDICITPFLVVFVFLLLYSVHFGPEALRAHPSFSHQL